MVNIGSDNRQGIYYTGKYMSNFTFICTFNTFSTFIFRYFYLRTTPMGEFYQSDIFTQHLCFYSSMTFGYLLQHC